MDGRTIFAATLFVLMLATGTAVWFYTDATATTHCTSYKYEPSTNGTIEKTCANFESDRLSTYGLAGILVLVGLVGVVGLIIENRW